MLGCDFHCGYCQNWVTSQALRDDRAVSRPRFISPERLAGLAIDYGTPVIVSTYNEPLITCDWAVEVFKPARERGIVCGFISNGNGTPQALEFIRPYVDLYKIDLKTFNDKHYRELGGVLENVLDTVRRTHAMGFWVEIVTLLVPGFNDSDDEIGQIAEFLASVSPDLPWHVTAFHPDYKMSDVGRTPADTLFRAREAGRKAGLRYVYAGNVPGAIPGGEDTQCPSCGTTVICRAGFFVEENRLLSGACPSCGKPIPGVWEKDPPRHTKGVGLPQLVQLR
jgi:pyruvate formate lyase activating enzyme